MYIYDVQLSGRNFDAGLLLWIHRNVSWKIDLDVFDMMCTKYLYIYNVHLGGNLNLNLSYLYSTPPQSRDFQVCLTVRIKVNEGLFSWFLQS